MDIDESSFAKEVSRRIFYVACSRAMQRLILLVNADEEAQERIARAIDERLQFPPQGTITMHTQAEIFNL